MDIAKSILNFLSERNRPNAFNDIVEHCGQQIGKSAAQKALDGLVTRQKVIQKCYGKQKIYFIKQSNDSVELKQQMQFCTQKLLQSQQSIQSKQKQFWELQTQLKRLSGVRSLESLQEERGRLLDDIHTLNERLRQLETVAKETKYTPASAKAIEKHYDHFMSSYRKRKRICGDMLDAILEGYPKSKKALIEDIGMETDEAVGFAIEMKR